MQIISDVRTAAWRRPTALTIGNFDGIHLGHQALLRTLHAVAAGLAPTDSGEPAPAATGLLTFDPHPLAVLRPESAEKLLTTPRERLQLAGRLGVDLGILQPFTREIAATDPATFMGWLKEHINLAALVVGSDFALGRNRTGNLGVLAALGEKLGYRLEVIEPVEWQGRAVRSSSIRQFLRDGQVEEAAKLLGRLYHVTGVVVHGDRRGRQIGVPTANLRLPPEKLWPADGVYATHTWIHPAAGAPDTPPAFYASVTNIGVRPTVDGMHHRFETHLLDFPPAAELPGANSSGGDPGDLYGRTLTVEFVHRLRGEQRFAGLAELVAQIQADIAQARLLLNAPAGSPLAAAERGRTWAGEVQIPFFLEPTPV